MGHIYSMSHIILAVSPIIIMSFSLKTNQATDIANPVFVEQGVIINCESFPYSCTSSALLDSPSDSESNWNWIGIISDDSEYSSIIRLTFDHPVWPFEAMCIESGGMRVGKTALERIKTRDTDENNFFVGWKFHTRLLLL